MKKALFCAALLLLLLPAAALGEARSEILIEAKTGRVL